MFLIPLIRGTAGFGDGVVWTGIIFLAVSLVMFLGAHLGAGAEIGLGARGETASAEVLSLREEQRRFGGQTVAVWVARVRYRDRHGVTHEGDIDDCDEEERAILRPGGATRIKYDPDHPGSFVWADDARGVARRP